MEGRIVAQRTDDICSVLILGSAPDAVRARDIPRGAFSHIVAINNAWRLTENWDYLIHPEDFPAERGPRVVDPAKQTIITADIYVPVQNAFGGFVYAGGTMAFTAGYWALGELKPDVMAFLGCDMNYSGGNTHFYGKGEPDPLRDDVTLQSLEAKSARLMAFAALQNCVCVNLSEGETSRLIFPRSSPQVLSGWGRECFTPFLNKQAASFDQRALQSARLKEQRLGYMVESGRYWEVRDRFDAAALREVDRLWLAAAKAA
jgi:hypothetical protein